MGCGSTFLKGHRLITCHWQKKQYNFWNRNHIASHFHSAKQLSAGKSLSLCTLPLVTSGAGQRGRTYSDVFIKMQSWDVSSLKTLPCVLQQRGMSWNIKAFGPRNRIESPKKEKEGEKKMNIKRWCWRWQFQAKRVWGWWTLSAIRLFVILHLSHRLPRSKYLVFHHFISIFLFDFNLRFIPTKHKQIPPPSPGTFGSANKRSEAYHLGFRTSYYSFVLVFIPVSQSEVTVSAQQLISAGCDEWNEP